MTPEPTAIAPGRRDPEGRRRAIVTAAAELVRERGAAGLTHRAVAARAGVSLGSTTQYFASLDELRERALQLLAEQIDDELAEVEEQLIPLEEAPERMAEALHSWLCQQRQVRAEMALIAAAMSDAELRPLARRWDERMIEILSRHMDRERAEAIVLYSDGLTIHAALNEEPVRADAIARVFRALLGPALGGQAS